jgi:two-component system, LytTR family, sensor kinase
VAEVSLSNIHEPQFVNILGHAGGAIIFGIFVYLLLRDRAETRLRGSWLSVAAAGLACLWNVGSLAVLITFANHADQARLLVLFSFSILSLLPAVLLHISLDEGRFWPMIGFGYALSLVAVGMHIREFIRPGQLNQQRGLLVITVGFAILTLLSVGAVILRGPGNRRARASRIFGTMCSSLFAMSFVHFGSSQLPHAWSSELVLHHAGIPLALFVLLQDYRFVLLDAFVRFLANALVAAILTFIAIRIAFRWIVVDERLTGDAMNEALLLLSLCLLLIGFALARGQIQKWLTRVVFRRPDLNESIREIESRGLSGEEVEFLEWAVKHLAQFLYTDHVEMVPDYRIPEIEDQPALLFPVPASDIPALRSSPDFAWAEAVIPLRLGHADIRYVLVGRRRGGRRYLSEDLQALSRLTAAIVEQVERFRNSEMQRLVSQAELRALQSQINPHFLFNALNTLYGIIPREALGARKTVLNLSEIFRYFLQSERTFIRLSEELEIVTAYLEIERLRLGPRLETEVTVDEAALSVLIPVLSIQPLVENAIKHGLSAKSDRGRLAVTARLKDREVVIAVNDTGYGSTVQKPSSHRSGAGVGLANVKRRLQLCFGPHADLVMDSTPAGTRVQFSVPLDTITHGGPPIPTVAAHRGS